MSPDVPRGQRLSIFIKKLGIVSGGGVCVSVEILTSLAEFGSRTTLACTITDNVHRSSRRKKENNKQEKKMQLQAI